MPSPFRYLTCGCYRNTGINIEPTVRRHGYRNPEEQIARFCAPHSVDVDDDLFTVAFQRTAKHFGDIFGTLRPYYITDRINDLAKSTSPGPVFKNMGFDTKTDVLNSKRGMEQIILTYARLKRLPFPETKHYPSMVVVTDTVETIETGALKSRVAWVYPINILALECMFATPFIDRLPVDWVPSPETHHARFCGSRSKSFDFSKFDTSIHNKFIYRAFDVLFSCLDFSYFEGGAFKANPDHLLNIWRFITHYFVHTPFKTNTTDNIRYKHHGVPSGSMFTNLIDTIVSRMIMEYMHLYFGCKCNISTYGDDIHCSNCTCNPDDLERLALKLGLLLKIESCNEHGCLTYCKAECHMGVPFHSGLWFRNILNKAPARYLREVVECIIHYAPTYDQLRYLKRLITRLKPSRWLHAKFKVWRDKFLEFRAKLKSGTNL